MCIKKVVGFVSILVAIMVGVGSNLENIIDIPSFLIVFGLTFGGLLASGRKIIDFCSVLFDKHASPDQLIEASETSQDAGNYAMASGFVGILIGAILMLANIDEPAAIGPGLAIAILTVLYGVFLKYFIFTPISRGMDQRAEKIYLQQRAQQVEKAGNGGY